MQHRPVSSIIENQRFLALPPTSSIVEAARAMREAHVSALLVVQGKRLVGIFTERDALFKVIAAGRDPAATRLSEVMTREPRCIAPDRPFGHALHLMFEGEFRHVPVVDNGRPIGMVSARDVLGPELKEFAQELESRDHIACIL